MNSQVSQSFTICTSERKPWSITPELYRGARLGSSASCRKSTWRVWTVLPHRKGLSCYRPLSHVQTSSLLQQSDAIPGSADRRPSGNSSAFFKLHLPSFSLKVTLVLMVATSSERNKWETLPSDAKEWKHQVGNGGVIHWLGPTTHSEPLSCPETKKDFDYGVSIPWNWGHQEPPTSYTYPSIWDGSNA